LYFRQMRQSRSRATRTSAETTPAEAYEQIAEALFSGSRDGALLRFCRLLDAHDALDATELALPGDRRRAEQLIAIREAVPAGVNRRVGVAKRDVHPQIEKDCR
jgi:hypothetical protein